MGKSAEEPLSLSEKQYAEMFRNYVRAQGMLDLTRLEALGYMGLTVMELRVMSVLSTRQFVLAGAIADSLKVRPSTATGVVDRLARHGLATRQRDPDDRRAVRVLLTEQGKRLIWEVQKLNLNIWNQLLQGLTQEDIAILARALELMVEAGERQGLIRRRRSNGDFEGSGGLDGERGGR